MNMMKIKIKWHKFLCKVFSHKWDYHEEDIGEHRPNEWLICKRCAKAKQLEPRIRTQNCLCTFIPAEPSKKDLEFIEFRKAQKAHVKQIEQAYCAFEKPKGETNENKD